MIESTDGGIGRMDQRTHDRIMFVMMETLLHLHNLQKKGLVSGLPIMDRTALRTTIEEMIREGQQKTTSGERLDALKSILFRYRDVSLDKSARDKICSDSV